MWAAIGRQLPIVKGSYWPMAALHDVMCKSCICIAAFREVSMLSKKRVAIHESLHPGLVISAAVNACAPASGISDDVSDFPIANSPKESAVSM